MDRTITVRGTGRVSVEPDLSVLRMSIRSLDRKYEKAMDAAAVQIASLQTALEQLGFRKQDLKTESFNVCSEYEGLQDENGNYRNVFKGFACTHMLKLEFSFDTERLSSVLSAAAGCTAEPELSISFSVKDQHAVREALLKDAAENAKQKAQTLCAASGVRLGELLNISYDWNDMDIASPTGFAMEKRCMAMDTANMQIQPDQIMLSDEVSFVWQIQ